MRGFLMELNAWPWICPRNRRENSLPTKERISANVNNLSNVNVQVETMRLSQVKTLLDVSFLSP
jgi:hypothetical protein